MPVWRRDEETGKAYSLKMTAAGLKAIAMDDEGATYRLAGSGRALPTASEPSLKAEEGCG